MTDLIKITDLDTLESPAAGDYIPVVDISDTTQGPGGTTKKVTKERLKGLNWQGAWSAGTYVQDDAVENDGSAWVCTATSTTEEPSISATDWDLLASKGDTGSTGSTGSTGAAGADGADGEFITTFQGAWSAGTYTIGEIVTNAGSSWICTAASTTEQPTGTPTDWAKIAAKGDTGATGPAGSGSGDMLAATYDPLGKNGNAFDTDNHVDGTTNKVYTATEKTKLAGIEASADVTDAGNVGSVNAAATSKATPVNADSFPIVDSEASNVIKRLTFTNLKAFLKTYFDTLYELAGAIATHAALTATHGATGAVMGTTNTQTTTNKRVNPRTASSTTASTLTPDLATANIYYRTTQTATLTVEAPIGTPVIGETIAIYIDSAGAQTLTMNATYIPFGVAFPATTTAGKTLMITAQYNGTNWKTVWANAV